MSYLSSTSVVVDAILTKKGRELLARNNGSFQITQFSLADDEIPELNESRARREHYQAELAKLEVDLKRRELVPAVDVKKEAFAMGRSVREALANLADRLSHQLAGETDPAAIHQVLTEEHRAALVELADG